MEILKLIRTHAVIPFLYLHDYYNGLNFNNTIGVFIKWTFNYSVVIEILASFYCTLKFNNKKKINKVIDRLILNSFIRWTMAP